MKKETKACIGIIFVNVMWGLSFIASKYAMAHGLAPFSLAMIRYIVAPVILLFSMLCTKTPIRFPKKNLFLMILSGLFGATVYFFFENNGVLRTTAANAALIIATIPVFTMLSAVLFHRKRPKVKSWIGAGLSLIGVYLIVSADDGGTSTLAGNLLMLCACVCWIIYIETTDVLLKDYSSLEITFWQSVFSMISLIPLGLTEGVVWKDVTVGAYLAAGGFLGVICSAACYYLFAYSIRHLSPIRTSVFININPLAAVLGSVFLLHERITAVQILGGVIIVGGIFLVNYAKQGKVKQNNGGKDQ